MTNDDLGALLCPREASVVLSTLGVSRTPSTLAKLRVLGGGPNFRRFGRAIKYTRTDLESWVHENLSRPLRSTSDIDSRET